MTKKPILSSNGIHRLHHTFFVPTGEIKASLLIVHGMSEHSGRYAKFANFLADNGILVLTYDQLGHGHTVKDKYELGFIDEKYPIQTLSKDVIVMADALKAKAKSLSIDKAAVPCFIMGHSMGSFLVRTVLTHHATSFDGVILMGTSHRFGVYHQAMYAQLQLLNRLRPKRINLPMMALINQYLLKQLSFPISASHFAWLAENTDAVRAFEDDPLCGFAFSNNGLYALQGLLKKAVNPACYAYFERDFGVLLVSGKDDPVGGMGQEIVDFADELIKAGKDCSVILYPNMRHEILHEKDNCKVYSDILTWLQARIIKKVNSL